jgi:hypothetical protein
MELVLALIGTFTGIAGLVVAIVMTKWQIKKQIEWQDSKDRLAFLSNVIFDTAIPRESRQPFYDEYIAKGGNGTVLNFG